MEGSREEKGGKEGREEGDNVLSGRGPLPRVFFLTGCLCAKQFCRCSPLVPLGEKFEKVLQLGSFSLFLRFSPPLPSSLSPSLTLAHTQTRNHSLRGRSVSVYSREKLLQRESGARKREESVHGAPRFE